MSCKPHGKFDLFPGQYKSTTGLQIDHGCPIRLRELNDAAKPAPTKLQGSQVARENYIRRRVATIRQVKNCLPEDQRFKGEECNEEYAYGPVFGLAKAPRYGGRNSENLDGGCRKIYYANGGSGSDVAMWKRLYGGPRILYSTSGCRYGCCDANIFDGKDGCVCFTLTITGFTSSPQVGDILGIQGQVPFLNQGRVRSSSGGTVVISVLGSGSLLYNFMRSLAAGAFLNQTLVFYYRDPLDKWQVRTNAGIASVTSTAC